jgi:hypothetical protein
MASQSIESLQAEVNRLQSELNAVHHDEGEMIYIGEYICRRLVQLGVTVCESDSYEDSWD